MSECPVEKPGMLKTQVAELRSLTHAPIQERKARIWGNGIRIEHRVLNANVEVDGSDKRGRDSFQTLECFPGSPGRL